MSQMEGAKDQQSPELITLVLLGMKNENKYMIGNTILQNNYFADRQELYASNDTKVCDQSVCIINTPDHFHGLIPDPEAYSKEELQPSYPGPRAFLLVLQDNKLSQEEMMMFKKLKERYGEKMVENTIVVLVSSKEESSGESCDRADENLKQVLDECGRRICVHNRNQDMKNPELIKQIMHIWNKTQKRVHEANNSPSGGEHLYEEADDIVLKNEKLTSKGEHEQSSADDYITLVLLGKNNADKCLIGNTILGKNQFQSANISCEMNTGRVEGQSVRIIKTPDLSQLETHRMEGLKPSFQESRVFLLVLQGKKSQEEMEMLSQLKERFGRKMVENTILLVEESKRNFSSQSKDKPRNGFKNEAYKQLLEECGNRVCHYNKDITKDELVPELMKYTQEIMKNQDFKPDTERTCNSISPEKNFAAPMSTPNQSDNQEHQSAAMTVRETSCVTIVLLGQTGSGKSATGNTILGKRRFESHASSVPVTKVCQTEEDTVCGMKIRVIDTPDFFDEDLKNQAEQLNRCKELVQHEPVVYLLIMELGRFTDGERVVLTHLKKEFGDDVTTNMVILFTSKEKLQNKTLSDYVNETDEELQQLIQTCSSRCHAFNNNKKNSEQVKKLMEIISKMQTDGNISMVKSDKRPNNSNKLNMVNNSKESKNCRIL